MAPRTSRLRKPQMFTKRIFVTYAAINLIYTRNRIILPLGMIYFIVADSKYDVWKQRLRVRFLISWAVLLHCLFVEAKSIFSISFIWIWAFEKGVWKIKGLNLFTFNIKKIWIRLALLKDMLEVEWWYCVPKFLVDHYDKAILTRVSPILLYCLYVEATHILV